MIDIKFCKKCKRAYNIEICPYCKQDQLDLKNIKKRIRDGKED